MILCYKPQGLLIYGNSISNVQVSVKNINNGGCGYFAYKLYQKLDHSKYSLYSINDVSHIVILEKGTGYYIDCDGYHTKLYMQIVYGFKFCQISEKYLINIINHDELWNKKFNRSDTLLINSFIKKIMKK